MHETNIINNLNVFLYRSIFKIIKNIKHAFTHCVLNSLNLGNSCALSGRKEIPIRTHTAATLKLGIPKSIHAIVQNGTVQQCLKRCRWIGKQKSEDPDKTAPVQTVRSGSASIALICLSQYLDFLQYVILFCCL